MEARYYLGGTAPALFFLAFALAFAPSFALAFALTAFGASFCQADDLFRILNKR